MGDLSDISVLMDTVANFGFSFVFLWLFVRELIQHQKTREDYRADLREIAGLRQSLRMTNPTKDTSNATKDTSNTEQINK
jgi:hypothetical protein